MGLVVKRLWLRVVIGIGVLAVVGIVAGCSSRQSVPQQRSQHVAFTESQVLLGPGDVIEVVFRLTPELNVVQTVRPDGRVWLQQIGEVAVAGKTPRQLQAELMGLYSVDLKNHEILINVQSLYSRRVYVGGEVNTPGVVEFAGQMTPLDAIMQAGGFNTDTAGANRVMVIRYENGVQRGYRVNLGKVLDGDESEPFYLMPYDVINVPRSRAAAINHFVDQYVNGMIPQVILSSIPFIVYREYFQD